MTRLLARPRKLAKSNQRPGLTPHVDRSDEQGATMSEVIVTMAIAAAVAISLMGVLQSTARHDVNQEQRIGSQTEIWRASDQIASDIRLGALAPDLTIDHSGETLPILISNPDGTRSLVQWQVTPAGLVRHTSDAVIGAKPHSVLIAPSVGSHETRASFVYLTSDGYAIDPRTAPDKLIICTARVEIRLHSINDLGQTKPNHSSAAFRVNPKAKEC